MSLQVRAPSASVRHDGRDGPKKNRREIGQIAQTTKKWS